jgi:hypothetical protein
MPSSIVYVRSLNRYFLSIGLTIPLVKSIGWHSNQMRMNVAGIDHLRNHFLDRRGSEQTHVHLKLVLAFVS